MPPGRNSIPLEKTLLAMDLSRGLDERARPEVGGDQSKLITKLENLVQDQTGGWVSRDYVGELSGLGTTDESSVATGTMRKLFSTRDGFAAMNTSCELMQYSESSGKLRRVGRASEFKVRGHYVSTSQTSVHSTTATVPHILACASTDVYEAVVYEAGISGANYGATLVVYDKYSGAQIAKYPCEMPSGTGSTVRPIIKMVFILRPVLGGGFPTLHLYTWNQAGGGELQFASISFSSLPASGTEVNFATTGVTVTDALYDVGTGSNNGGDAVSIACLGTDGAVSKDLVGNQKTSTPPAGDSFTSVDVDDDNGLAWFVGRDSGTGRLQVIATTFTDISAAATYSWIDPTVTIGATDRPMVACSSEGKLTVTNQVVGAVATNLTISTVNVYRTTAKTDTSVTSVGMFRGWACASTPFYLHDEEKPYIHLVKYSNLTTEGPVTNIIASLHHDDVVTNKYGDTTTAIDVNSFRVAAMVEPFNAAIPSSFLRYIPYPYELAGTEAFTAYAAYMGVQRGVTVAGYEMRLHEQDSNNYAQFAGDTIIGGGHLAVYDGSKCSELGLVDEPVFSVTAVGGGSLTGSYNYIAVARHLSVSGKLSFSKVYGPVSVTLAAENGGIILAPTSMTAKETGINTDTQIVYDVYRTQSGGTQYQLVCTSQLGHTFSMVRNAAIVFTYTDSTSDATLITRPLAHRQPGTVGTSLDRCPAPASHIVCAHKDRIFTIDPFGDRVNYSSFFVDGETLWFNAQLSFLVHGGTGPITGMASMDGRLYIFKRDAVFVVDGDGPPENGGSGAEFSPPSKLAVEYGCIDPRSICNTPLGIIYRSRRGIELLTRSGQGTWIGERVQNTVSDNPVTKSVLLYDDSRLYVFLAESESTTSDGIVLLYDLSADCWSVLKYTVDSVYGRALRGAATWELTDGNRRIAILYGLSTAKISYIPSIPTATETVPWTIETGWIRPTGAQGRHVLHDAMLLGRYNNPDGLVDDGDSAITMALAYDYEEDGSGNDYYDNTRLWTVDVLPTENSRKKLLELDLPAKRAQPVTFKLKVASATSVFDALGICFVVSPKAGAQLVAPHKR